MSETPASAPAKKKSKSRKGRGKENREKKNKEPRDPQSRNYKIIIRKLPIASAMQGFVYNENDFKESLDKVCDLLQISKDDFRVEHFREGRLR